MKTWITPSLVVVTAENAVNSALVDIESGTTGYVTTLDEAREVMTKLGMSEEAQNERIHFAFTGEIIRGGR